MNEAAAKAGPRAPSGAAARSELIHAELPVRGAAFLLDALVAAAFVYLSATLVGVVLRSALARGGSAEAPAALLFELAAAVGCVLPTALVALQWHRSAATPGQRMLGLRVVDDRTLANLSLSAAFARWVLLFAPLALLIAFPQIALTAISPEPFLLILVEVPWLTLAAPVLALAWYALLAGSALADPRRLRAAHDRLAGSVVVRIEGAAAEPGRATQTREADMRNLVPFVWLNRPGIAWYTWLFVGAAVVVGGVSIAQVLEAAATGAAVLVQALLGVAATAAVLAPAALLWRVPNAGERYPVLLAGLALAAGLITLRAMLDALNVGFLDSVGGAPMGWLSVVATLAIALGLIALRRSKPSRPALLVLLSALFLSVALATLLSSGAYASDLYSVGGSLFSAAASAFLAWVILGAWLDREAPRAFWAVLGAAVGLDLLGPWLGVAGMTLMGGRDVADLVTVQAAVSLVYAFGAAAAGFLSLVAYGMLAPRD